MEQMQAYYLASDYNNIVTMRGDCRLCKGPYNIKTNTPGFPRVYASGWCPKCMAEIDGFGSRCGARPSQGYVQQCFIYRCLICVKSVVSSTMPPLGTYVYCDKCRDDEPIIVGGKEG